MPLEFAVAVEASAIVVHLGRLPEGRKWFGQGVEFLIAWLEY